MTVKKKIPVLRRFSSLRNVRKTGLCHKLTLRQPFFRELFGIKCLLKFILQHFVAGISAFGNVAVSYFSVLTDNQV